MSTSRSASESRIIRREEVKPHQLVDEVALAVDHDDRAAVLLRGHEVRVDHALHELGLAVAGAADDVAVLEADRVRDVEGNGELRSGSNGVPAR